MALELAKKQVLYAISRVMEMADVEEVDWIGIDGMRYSFDGIKGNEIKTIYKPNLEDWTIDISEIPSYSFCLLPRHFSLNDLRLVTYERMFYAVLERLWEVVDGFSTDNEMEILKQLAEEYLLKTNEN